MMPRILIAAMLAAAAPAQEPVAPTNLPVGPPRGEDRGGYNLVNSFETGYRFHTVDGNLGKYRSDVNYGNGVRLLSSSFSIHAREGHGAWLDELLLNTQGLGNDPYESASFRVQKNRVYRYDLLWRRNEYYNPGLNIALGQHFLDTTRALQDHSFTLLPQSWIKFFAGYSRNQQHGPGLSTIQVFDIRGDEFPLFSNVRRSQDELRIGSEIALGGLKLSWMRGWEWFKDDDEQAITGPLAGNHPDDATTLTSFRRAQPYHGGTNRWLVNVLYDRDRLYSLNGRFTYAGGRRRFIFDELLSGTDRFGAARARQLLVFGDARRPVLAANLTTSIFPARTITVVNHTSIHHTRMEGDGSFREMSLLGLFTERVNFRFLGIRTIASTTDLDIRVHDRVNFRAGYHASTRRIRSIAQELFESGPPERAAAEQSNVTHTGLFGIRVRLASPLTLNLDSEIGRANRPFFPVSDRDYHLLGARLQYRARNLQFSAAARSHYNFNSASLASHSSRARSYSADASWSPRPWAGVDGGYSKLHLDTLSGIAYFAAGDLISGRSLYISNLHFGHATVRLSLRQRVDVFAGYSRVQDTGDGRRAGGTLLGRRVTPQEAAAAAFSAARTYPVAFSTPMARVSIRLRQNVRWNIGYQRYEYAEEFGRAQDYRAHTGYTSLTWSF